MPLNMMNGCVGDRMKGGNSKGDYSRWKYLAPEGSWVETTHLPTLISIDLHLWKVKRDISHLASGLLLKD